MARIFVPDEPESSICAECGWNREEHAFGNCPSHLTCGHWSNECTCGNESRTDPQPKRPPSASRAKTWGDYHREAIAAGMDDASACHSADMAMEGGEAPKPMGALAAVQLHQWANGPSRN